MPCLPALILKQDMPKVWKSILLMLLLIYTHTHVHTHTTHNQALQKCSAEAVKLLSSGTVDLTTFGIELFSNRLLELDALNTILCTVGIPPSFKFFQMWGAVLAQVESNPHMFEVFMEILKKYATLQHLVDRIYEHVW